jgi:hypothetical protein
MKNRQRQIRLTTFIGVVLLTLSGLSSSFAQSTSEFAGTWNTVTGKGKKIAITFTTTDRRTTVNGIYAVNGLTSSYEPADRPGFTAAFVKVSFAMGEPGLQSQSTITGTVSGNVLRFKWREDGGRGAGRFTMSADGQSFEGTYSKTDNPDDTSGGTWNGTRAPVFQGAWQTGPFPSIVLQQSGNRVTGQLIPGRPDLGMIKDGVIDGNTLRFTLWRSSSPIKPPEQFMGTGELVMEKGSRSFKGTILGTPVTGTRLGR